MGALFRYILFALLVLVGCKSQKEPATMATESKGVSTKKSIGEKPAFQIKRPSIAKGQVRLKGAWGSRVSVEFSDQQYFEVIDMMGMGETVRLQPPKEGEALIVSLDEPGIHEEGSIQTIDVVFVPGEEGTNRSCRLIRIIE